MKNNKLTDYWSRTKSNPQ